MSDLFYDEYQESRTVNGHVKRRYDLTVSDDRTDEVIYEGVYFTDESLQQDLRNVDKAFTKYEAERDPE